MEPGPSAPGPGRRDRSWPDGVKSVASGVDATVACVGVIRDVLACDVRSEGWLIWPVR